MAALFKAQDDMLALFMRDRDELARLRRERSEQPPMYRSETPVTGIPDNTETTAPTEGARPADQALSASPSQEIAEQEIRWPVSVP